MAVALSAAAAGWSVTLAGTGGDDDVVESVLDGVRVLRWRRPEPLAAPVHVTRRALDAVLAYPDRTAGRSAARRVAALRRRAQVRAAERALAARDRPAALAAAAVTPALRAVDVADKAAVTGRTLLHRTRWTTTQQRATGETPEQRALRRALDRALVAELEIGPRIEGLDPDVVWVVGAAGLAPGRGAVLRRRVAGGDVRLVCDLRADVAVPDGDTPERRRLARERLRTERAALRVADAVVVPTERLRAALLGRCPGAGPVLLGDGVPPDPGSVEDLRDRLGLDREVPLVALPHADDPAVAAVLAAVTEAVAGLPGVHLAVLSPAATSALRAARDLAWSRSLRNRWHLVTGDGATRPATLAGATAVVVPAPAPPAAAVRPPRGYLSALAAHRPVVAHATPVLVEALRQYGAGVAVDLTDPVATGSALREVLSTADLLAARAARARVPAFDAAGVVQVLDATGLAPARPPEAAPALPAVVSERRVTPEPERRVLGVGPANFAGQGWAWAKAAERAVPGLRTEVFAVDQGVLTFRADRRIRRRDQRALAWQLDEQRRVLTGYTHLLAEANRPVFGLLNGEDLAGDLPALRRAGLVVGIALHGSEVRDPAAHAARERWSPFRDAEDDLTRRVAAFVARTRAVLDAFDGPVFASTPDLLDDVPAARWLPVVVDTDLPPAPPPLQRDVPVVVHVPSKSRMKGSADVEPALARLTAEGVCEYRRLTGVPPEQMPAVLADADIVLDQFALGSYGVLACEAMAAGRVVVGHVRPEVRARVGGDLPVVEATPDDVEAVLRGLLDARGEAVRVAQAGQEFVRKVHDGRRAGRVLAEALLALPS